MKKPLAILIYSLAAGGAERVVVMLAKELCKSYDITLVLMNRTIFYKVPDCVHIIYLENSKATESSIKKFLKLPLLGWRYKNLLRKRNIRTSISFMNRPNYINIFAKLFGSRSETIISERVAPLGEYGTLSVKDIINRTLIKILYPKAKKIVPNSLLIKDELSRFFHIPNHKMQTIYNPIYLEMIEKVKNEPITLKKDKFTFITIARLERQKNHTLLIESFYKSGLDAQLWIIGEGYLKEELKAIISKYSLQDRVLLLGYQKNPYKFLDKADCFVLSSNYEGFPNALMEALACALPTISTDCTSGPREILAPKSNYMEKTKSVEMAQFGILVSINDPNQMANAMQTIYKNESLRLKYKKLALTRAKEFKLESIVKDWIQLIEKD